ncbi:MAG: hypothetical protein JF589_10915, partial [Gemmatimonadetes bacterium]|nr:hypothetical protein [Gemmatimonadota bacterium]
LVADDPRIVVGWFLLGTMRIERDLQYGGQQKTAFAKGPFVVGEIDRLLAALARLDAAERARQLALLHAGSLDELRARRSATVTVGDAAGARGAGAEATVVRVVQPTLDALDTLTLELRADPSRVAIEAAGDSATLRARSGTRIPFVVRITTTGRTLTPIKREEIFTPAFLDYLAATRADAARAGASSNAALSAHRTERQVRGLELLVSHEKLMAGLPTYATYFGRDMLMSTLMLRPVWKPAMSEFAIASALRKLSPDGRVSHEEALGGQAVREASAEYATLVDSALAASAGAARDALLERARVVLRDIRRVRENYHMIDAEFQLPILEARWLRDPAVSDARKRAFLLDAADGEPRVARLLRELALLAELTAPYAHDPVTSNLVSFAPRDSGRWASQSWRDSEVGYARGRYAMDVNAIWAPHALEATAQILDALRTLGLLGDTLVRRAAPKGDESALVAYVRDPAALGTATARWQGASRHFVVRLGPAEVRERVQARLAAMPEGERRHWNGVLAATGADRDSLVFLALSLDAQGRPIDVANSDVATRLFLGETEGPSRAPDASERAAVLRDVRTFARRYPVGLLIEGVGPAVANDAYASPSVWADFERDRYHGPRVVWGRENNLFLLGTMQRVRDAGTAPELVAYRRELMDAIAQVRTAVDASGFHSELWSYELHDGKIVPMRYGSGSDVQLWSTTDLAVGFAQRASRR